MAEDHVTSLIKELRGASNRTRGNPLYDLAADAITVARARIAELEESGGRLALENVAVLARAGLVADIPATVARSQLAVELATAKKRIAELEAALRKVMALEHHDRPCWHVAKAALEKSDA